MWTTTRRQQLALGGGLLFLLAFLVRFALLQDRGEQRSAANDTSAERVKREGRAAEAAVVDLARKDLGCEDVGATTTTEGIVATGCDRRARYLWDGSRFHRSGEIEAALSDASSDGCRTLWTSTTDGGATAAGAVAAISARRHSARLRVPIAATGIRGLAKLRWGDTLDTFVDAGAPPVTAIPVPCADAGASPASAASAGSCTLPFDAVTEIAECP